MKEKFVIEVPFNCSPKVLFNRLSTPGGLSEWFADDVNLKDIVYTFVWNGSEEQAEKILYKENKYIRFHWLDDDDPKTYFEFRITSEDLTGEQSLIITDHAEEDDIEDSKELWEKQVSELKHQLGL